MRQLVLTAERTVTRAGDVKKVLTAELRLENGPHRARDSFADVRSVGCRHVSGLFDAARMAAGPDAIRGLGPYQLRGL